MKPNSARKLYKIESSFWVPADIETVWDVGCRPQSLAKISPKHLNVSVDFDGEAYEGLEIKIRFKPSFSPLGLTWVSKIYDVISTGDERQFVDDQVSGPFAYWKHTHKFVKGTKDVESSTGQVQRSLTPGTWIIDQVEYQMPLGLLGKAAHCILVEKILKDMFRDRKKAFTEIFSKKI